MPFLEIAIFTLSCLAIIISSKWVIDSMSKLARSLGWKEYVVAFFTISLGAVLPELTIGIRASIGDIAELSFGNIVGQNIMLLTFAVGVCTLVVKDILVQSRTVRSGATFAAFAVILPFILLRDGVLSRINGVILIVSFFLYVIWLFKEQDRFVKEYDGDEDKIKTKLGYLKHFLVFLASLIIVIFSAEGIIHSSVQFAEILGVTEGVIGILLVGAGVALPEIYFSVKLASKGRSWMILGGLMGAVAMSSTLVLGIVSLVNPIVINDFTPYNNSRIFLIFSGLILWFFVRTNNRLMKREAFALLIIYFTFLFFEVYFGGILL